MWPYLLDMTKDESVQSLRSLELEAYSCLVSALRAQGSLNQEKLKLLKDASVALNISQDRHKAEIRRAVNDERLNTIAYHASGQKMTTEEWAIEGRRLVPLMQRVVPQTAYSAIADEIADASNKHNRQLPNPSSTERKRPATPNPSGVSDINRSLTFRAPELNKLEETKKRKLSVPVENSSLSLHVMGPPKMSRIQQIYRQKTKVIQAEQMQAKVKTESKLVQGNKVSYQQFSQSTQQKTHHKGLDTSPTTSNVNVLQNVSIAPSLDGKEVEAKLDVVDTTNQNMDAENVATQSVFLTEAQQDKTVATTCAKLNQQAALKSPGIVPKKTINTKCIAGQKLIVVSNPQSIATTSILQRTLTIPFVKNISVKNFDKFKIVTTNSNSNVQFTTLTSIAQNNVTKHKVVTVRTNPTVKKVIPLSQLQILNAKGGIKVLPIGGKIVTKTNSGSTPVYIVNSSNMQCLTKCTSSTPVVMTCKPQGSPDNKSLLVVKNSQTNNSLTHVEYTDATIECTPQESSDDARKKVADNVENSVECTDGEELKEEETIANHDSYPTEVVQTDETLEANDVALEIKSEIAEAEDSLTDKCDNIDNAYSNGVISTIISSDSL